MGLASHRGVERLETPGRTEQQRRSVAAARARERDLRAQPLQPRALKLVERGKLRRREHRLRRLGRARVQLRVRGCQRPRSPQPRIGSQLGRSLQERRGGRDAAPTLRSAGRALQIAGHRLVEPGGRVRAMPCAPIGIRAGIGHLGQRAVDGLALGPRRRCVDRRADQGMPEAHPGPELEQLRCLRRAGRVGADAELLGRAPEERDVTGRLGCRDEEQLPRVGRKRLEAAPEAPLDPPRQWATVRQPEPSRQFGRRQATRQLQQCEGVAARFRQDAVADARVHRPADPGRQDRACVVVAEPLDAELRQARELVRVARLADREHHGDPLGQQPPRDERERLPGGSVEPLRVVDHARERRFLRLVGQQAQDCERHPEVIRGAAVLEPERLAQRVPLWTRKSAYLAEHRTAQLMQAGERELHLGLHSRGSNDAAAGCVLHQVLQQRGLADARLAAQDQHLALV